MAFSKLPPPYPTEYGGYNDRFHCFRVDIRPRFIRNYFIKRKLKCAVPSAGTHSSGPHFSLQLPSFKIMRKTLLSASICSNYGNENCEKGFHLSSFRWSLQNSFKSFSFLIANPFYPLNQGLNQIPRLK